MACQSLSMKWYYARVFIYHIRDECNAMAVLWIFFFKVTFILGLTHEYRCKSIRMPGIGGKKSPILVSDLGNEKDDRIFSCFLVGQFFFISL